MYFTWVIQKGYWYMLCERSISQPQKLREVVAMEGPKLVCLHLSWHHCQISHYSLQILERDTENFWSPLFSSPSLNCRNSICCWEIALPYTPFFCFGSSWHSSLPHGLSSSWQPRFPSSGPRKLMKSINIFFTSYGGMKRLCMKKIAHRRKRSSTKLRNILIEKDTKSLWRIAEIT